MSQQATALETEVKPGATVDREFSTKWFIRLLFVPTLGLLILLAIFPLFYSIGVSFTNYTLGSSSAWVGLRNYKELFASGELVLSSWVTIRFTIFAVAIEMVLGILIAFVLNERLPGIGVVRVIVFLPMMLAPLVVGTFWRFMLDQTFGLVNWLLGALGIPPVFWLVDPSAAMAAIILVDVWQWTPFVVLLTLASLGTIPNDLRQAAILDRAPTWMKFRHIYWPYMRFPVLFAFLFRTIDCLKMFDLAYALTGGGPGNLTATASLLSYWYLFQYFRVGKAAAVAWIIVIAISIIVNILMGFLMPAQKAEEEVVSTGL